MNARKSETEHSTVLCQIYSQQNMQYLKVIIESLMFTVQQNISQCGNGKNRHNMLNEQFSKHAQWTSAMIQNELLCLLADQVRKIIVCDV